MCSLLKSVLSGGSHYMTLPVLNGRDVWFLKVGVLEIWDSLPALIPEPYTLDRA